MSDFPWINVVIILLLGVAFIFGSWLLSRRVSTADEYIAGRGKMGVAFGVTSLLAFWVTGNAVLTSAEATYDIGIGGAAAYGLMFGLSIVAFWPLARRILYIIPHGRTIGDFYRTRLGKLNFTLFIVILIPYLFGFLVTQGVGGGLLLEQTFDIPYEFALLLTIVIATSYASMGGFSSVAGLAFFQMVIILIVAVIVPPIVYLTTGTAPVYDGLLEHMPEALDIVHPSALFLFFTLVMITTGAVFMDNTFWQRTYAMRRTSIFRTFGLAGLGCALATFAFASLALVAISMRQEPDQVNQVAPFIAQLYGGQTASWLFLIGVWAALTSTIAALINGMVSLLMNDVYLRMKPAADERSRMRFVRCATVTVGLVTAVLSLPQIMTLLELIVLLGVVNVAFIFPIVFGLFWSRLNTNIVFLALVLSMVVGFSVYFTVGTMEGVIVSGYVSCFVCWAGSLLWPSRFDWKRLRQVGADPGRVEEYS